MSKRRRQKKNSIDWMEALVQTIIGVVSGVISGFIIWLITK
jgi:hypothetical protein